MTAPSTASQIVSFPVEGMTCPSCVNRITRSLRKVHGVQAAKVNLATESATVRFDPAVADVARLAGAVESAGYLARVDQIEVYRAKAQEPPFAARHLAGIPSRVAVAPARSRVSDAIRKLIGLARPD